MRMKLGQSTLPDSNRQRPEPTKWNELARARDFSRQRVSKSGSVRDVNLHNARVAEAMVARPKVHSTIAPLQEISAVFENDHVHMALVVESDGRLVTCIERSDLAKAPPDATPVSTIGTLSGRTIGPTDELAPVFASMSSEGKRRLAVVDESGRLLGLLCLKSKGTGFCSDQEVRSRAIEHCRICRGGKVTTA